MKYQITFFAEKFKPVACIIEADSRVEFANVNSPKVKEAMVKVCTKRGWTAKEMIKYGYTKYQVRKAEGV